MIDDSPKALYLAGPISGLTYKQANMQRASRIVKDDLRCAGWIGLNPLEGYEELDDDTELGVWFEDRIPGSTPEQAVFADLRMINASEAVFANYFRGYRPSLGTAAEIGYAFGQGKPIVTLLPKSSKNNHPFIVHLSWAVVSSWDEALSALAELRQRLDPVPYA